MKASLLTLATALAAASLASAQTTIFQDDFESGLMGWAATGLWRASSELDPCSAAISPFPSSSTAAAFNVQTTYGPCTFPVWQTGTLTTLLPISIPASASNARLRFTSYEETECSFGNCGWDDRYVDVSDDGGQTWDVLAFGDLERAWFERYVSLDAYAGADVLIRFRFAPVDTWANDFRGWLVDDVRIEVDFPATNYCRGKIHSGGCVPSVSASGDPSFSGPDDLVITADFLLSNVMSKLIWSRAPAAVPFHGGTLCVQAPAARTTVMSSGGTVIGALDCGGSYSFSFSHDYLLSKGVVPGETLYVQASTRDPGFIPPWNHSLSNALQYTVLP